MSQKKIGLFSLGLIIIIVIGFLLLQSSNLFQADGVIQKEKFVANRGYTDISQELVITNDEENFLINNEVVPEEMRIPSGTNLSVNVVNNSDFETSLHFHGINGLAKMDGVGGVSQDNIKPGENFVYKFVLDEPGTYMYHSHVDSQEQVNNENLYGGLVVEDEEKTNEDMLLFNTNILDETRHDFANLSYDEVVLNGENSGEFKLDNDENLFFNVANLSSAPISINFGQGVKYRINSLDANEATSDWQVNKSLVVPTAQRLIVELKNPKKSFQISSSIKDVKNAKYNVLYKGDTNVQENKEPTATMDNSSMMDEELEHDDSMSDMDMESMSDMENMEHDDMSTAAEYDSLDDNSVYIYDIVSTSESLGLKDAEVDKSFDMALSMADGMWIIDDKAYPNTQNLVVNEGDVVEITLKNSSHMAASHPFHLHGHKFEVTSIDGKEVDKNLMMDTIDIKPDSEVTIRLNADNPGIWAFHCHNLNHAALGMMTLFTYEGYSTNVEGGASE